MSLFILVAGPHAGKTTQLKDLRNKGHRIVHEAARALIKQKKKGNPKFTPKSDIISFQEAVIRRQIFLESFLSPDRDYFIESGAPSGIAYILDKYATVPKNLITEAISRPYKKVFLLDQIPGYQPDAEREQTEEEAVGIHELIYKVYSTMPYPLIRVPVDTVENRTRFILSHL